MRRQLEALLKHAIGGKGTVVNFAPGFTFFLPCTELSKIEDTYLITRVRHQGEQPRVLAEKSDHDKGAGYETHLTYCQWRCPSGQV